MADKEIKISRERARMFAYVIYRDIAAYIESHQEEYQKFILEEEALNGKDTTTHRPKGVAEKPTGKAWSRISQGCLKAPALRR